MSGQGNRVISSNDVPAFSATGGSASRKLPDWIEGLGRAEAPAANGKFWADIDGGDPNSLRIRRRVFIGTAVDCNDNRITGGVRPAWGSYASWAPRDSDLAVMSSRGALAITGMSRTSDAVNDGGSTISTWGIGGLILTDRSTSTARAIYGDVQHENAALVSYGAEIVVKNKGTSQTTTPYFSTNGTYGITLSAGGDPSYGGSPTAPSNTALHIRGNGQPASPNFKWNRGIVFDAYGLTGTDGDGSGIGIAIEMALGHLIEWRTTGNNQGAYVYSVVTSGSNDVGILFANSSIRMRGHGGAPVFYGSHTADGAVNYLQAGNALASASPSLSAQGTDVDIDLTLTPKGAGTVRFGTFTTNADAPVTGYIMIKDAGGTLRKVAVIA